VAVLREAALILPDDLLVFSIGDSDVGKDFGAKDEGSELCNE
jgi:hypothetical protein